MARLWPDGLANCTLTFCASVATRPELSSPLSLFSRSARTESDSDGHCYRTPPTPLPGHATIRSSGTLQTHIYNHRWFFLCLSLTRVVNIQ
ncbi:hypothetical protein QQF64_008659 [Cirrhinus molitorella]|uniref:Secreted protein n=1 Tax=Cirrhinus molitorella TaxID=172907 RepID=A0ABR3MA94_9TELE